ncbi:ribosome-releasing factor 2, mitochondrial-like isoform X2 [Watersipora subatra]|uniref:ribosome-releasing factor 2, mitochondrial-like isoform X2 n=1 Tax=Watersipora subatra TaxID=2589382 RepID=UPI00355BFD6F
MQLKNLSLPTLFANAYSALQVGCRNHGLASKIFRSKKSVQKLSSPNRRQTVDKLRNVGIIAHIDAGKTTTTEQLLYYSGITDDIGKVDEGTTVTDYLPQERERGITIQSAAISLHWNQHRINILDTPGHIDFTVEVERVLRVMDSAIGILDASAGVEAQTKTVWRQANHFSLPRLIFLNKMDKKGADVAESLKSIKKDLAVTPLLTQCALGTESDLEGVVDLASLSKFSSSRSTSDDSSEKKYVSLSDGKELYEQVIDMRNGLIDDLADLDGDMMNILVSCNTYDDITCDDLRASLRRVTCNNKGVPVMLGSALKDCGIQSLLGAIVDYLPCPEENNSKLQLKDYLCAFAFKTVHQKERGAVTFLRLYGGSISGSSSVYNATQDCNEKVGRVYTILGNEMLETKTAQAGDIVGVTGLHRAVTGDTIMSKASAVQKYEEAGISLPPLTIPDPVFMCSVEAYSNGDQKRLDEALQILVKEDPSLRVKSNSETDQLVLSGMGELHLDITKDRLLKEHGLKVFLGPMLVAYREKVENSSAIIHHTLERIIGETSHHVSVSVSVSPSTTGGKSVKFVQTGESRWDMLPWFHRKPINQGAEIALSSGPLLGYPVSRL